MLPIGFLGGICHTQTLEMLDAWGASDTGHGVSAGNIIAPGIPVIFIKASNGLTFKPSTAAGSEVMVLAQSLQPPYNFKIQWLRPEFVTDVTRWDATYTNSLFYKFSTPVDLRPLWRLKKINVSGQRPTEAYKLPASLEEIYFSIDNDYDNGSSVGLVSGIGYSASWPVGLAVQDFRGFGNLKKLWIAHSAVKTLYLPIADNLEELVAQHNSITFINRVPASIKKFKLGSWQNDRNHTVGQSFPVGTASGVNTLDFSQCSNLQYLILTRSGVNNVILPVTTTLPLEIFGIRSPFNSFTTGGVSGKFPTTLKSFKIGFNDPVNEFNGQENLPTPTGLPTLDFRGCDILEDVWLTSNQVQALYLPLTNTVKTLHASQNKLTSINRYPTSLLELCVGAGFNFGTGGASNTSYGQTGAGLGAVDLTGCNVLTKIDFRSCGVTAFVLPASKTQIAFFSLGHYGGVAMANTNNLSSGFDASGLTNVLFFCLNNIKGTSANIILPSNASHPCTQLDLSNNNFSAGQPAISNFTNVTELYLATAQLTGLDLTGLDKVITLLVDGNKLTGITWAAASKISSLFISNQTSASVWHLNLTGNPVNMATVNATNSKINEITFAAGKTYTTVTLTSNSSLTTINTNSAIFSNAGTFNANLCPLIKSLNWGSDILSRNINISSNGLTQSEVNQNITNIWGGRLGFNNSAAYTKTFNIGGTNATPSGTYQQPAGFSHDLNESDLTAAATANSWSAKELIWILVNCQVSAANTTKRYTWTITYTA